MKLTTRSSYGIRALVLLAIAYGKGVPVSIRDISAEEQISGIYLEQIFNRLKNRGIVRSVRGPKGGYVLAEDPRGTDLCRVIEALEGGVEAGRCLSSRRNRAVCARAGKCASKEVWDEVTSNVKDTLRKYTLEDLARRAVELNPCRAVKEVLCEESIS